MDSAYKIFVTVPETHTQILIDSMAQAGAGKIGNYTHCAFITKGIGNYLPVEGAKPYIGKIGEMSQEAEAKIEMVCPKDKLAAVVKAIKSIHPYETPSIDVVEILTAIWQFIWQLAELKLGEVVHDSVFHIVGSKG